MSEVMLTYGTIAFSVTQAAYQALRRSTRYRIPALDRVGDRPGYQFTGPGEDGITLSGVIMPTYRGRPAVLQDLRALGAEGEAHPLTGGTGEVFGRWIMSELTEERSALFDNGQARKIAFTVKLMRDDDAPAGETAQLRQSSAEVGNADAVLDAVRNAVAAGQDSAGVIAAARSAP